MTSTALLTDQYELTMLRASLSNGTAHRSCVFELFARRLPTGRRYGVVAGVGRFLDALADFRFEREEIDWLSEQKFIDDSVLEWLSDFVFSGDIWGYAEGDVYFPGSPILVVDGTFAEAVVLETLALSVFNHDSAISSAASRMVTAAQGRPCVEMGARRTHELSAVAAARAAFIAGFVSTSNLEAGRTYGLPTAGTSAHSFTLLQDSEREAFRVQVTALGRETTLLVDTFDVPEAIEAAIEVAGPELDSVRLDSGDLGSLAHDVRRHLDALGAANTKIIVTSDLDEFSIAALAAAPVDGYGVGTSLVTGSGAPTSGFVYKLVAREDAHGAIRPVAKKSPDKTSVGGRKWASRRMSAKGTAQAEVVGDLPCDDGNDRKLLVPLVRSGQRVYDEPLGTARARLQSALAELPPSALRLSRGEPAIPTIYT